MLPARIKCKMVKIVTHLTEDRIAITLYNNKKAKGADKLQIVMFKAVGDELLASLNWTNLVRQIHARRLEFKLTLSYIYRLFSVRLCGVL